MKKNDVQSANAPFPNGCVGVSAAGLVALEQFLWQSPPKSGMALVIAPHLGPNREGMPVFGAQEQAQIKSNHACVISPGREFPIQIGTLHSRVPPEPYSSRLPIDFFFKFLTDDRQQNSFGVIVSGLQSDGTLDREVLQKLVLCEKNLSTNDGCCVKLRTMPYRAQKISMDDLVITFSDTTVSKTLELALFATQAQLQIQMENSNQKGVVDGLS